MGIIIGAKPRLSSTVDFTIGAEAADVVNVAGVLKDSNGATIANKKLVTAWLSDAAGGAPVAVAHSGGVAIGTNGVIIASVVANKVFHIITTAAGLFDLNITEAGAKTAFLNVEADGQVTSSAVITHAA